MNLVVVVVVATLATVGLIALDPTATNTGNGKSPMVVVGMADAAAAVPSSKKRMMMAVSEKGRKDKKMASLTSLGLDDDTKDPTPQDVRNKKKPIDPNEPLISRNEDEHAKDPPMRENEDDKTFLKENPKEHQVREASENVILPKKKKNGSKIAETFERMEETIVAKNNDDPEDHDPKDPRLGNNEDKKPAQQAEKNPPAAAAAAAVDVAENKLTDDDDEEKHGVIVEQERRVQSSECPTFDKLTLAAGIRRYGTIEYADRLQFSVASCSDSLTGVSKGVFFPTTGDGLCYDIDTYGSSFDTVLIILKGDSCLSATCLMANDDYAGSQSQVRLETTEGENYWIVVAGYGDETGNYVLNYSPGQNCPGAAEGEVIDSMYGTTVALSADATILALGALADDQNSNAPNGLVHVFRHEPDVKEWYQIGQDLVGQGPEDAFGSSIALSFDGLTLAIGAPQEDAGRDKVGAGRVRVFRYAESNVLWNSLGAATIDGFSTSDRFGTSVALSADGLTLAVGAGHTYARVFKYIDAKGDWDQVFAAVQDQPGQPVALSDNGSVVAIGVVGNNDNQVGRVSVYRDLGFDWSLLGEKVFGEASDHSFGTCVALNQDGSILAVGGKYHDATANAPGHVRVFGINGDAAASSWTQIGANIEGESAQDGFGSSIDLSANGSVVVIGAKYDDAGGKQAGSVRSFELKNNNWEPVGNAVYGSATGEQFGYAVAMTTDGQIVSAGASTTNEDDQGSTAGGQHVVYSSGADPDQEPVDIPSTLENTSGGQKPAYEQGRPNYYSPSGPSGQQPAYVQGRPNYYSPSGPSGSSPSGPSGQQPAYVQGRPNYYSPSGPSGSSPSGPSLYSPSGPSGSSPSGQYASSNLLTDGSVRPPITSCEDSTTTPEFWIPFGQQFRDVQVGAGAVDGTGLTVELSGDGMIMALSALRYSANATSGAKIGKVEVFEYSSLQAQWVQMGQSLLGVHKINQEGHSLALSFSGTILAISTPFLNDFEGHTKHKEEARQEALDNQEEQYYTSTEGYLNFGGTRVFKYDPGSKMWMQHGNWLIGDQEEAEFGSAVDLSADGSVLAVGAVGKFYGSAWKQGAVDVFKYNTTHNIWDRLGQVLWGQSTGRTADERGRRGSVALSSDGFTIAVGGAKASTNGLHMNGRIVVYKYDSTKNWWYQIGNEIRGEGKNSWLGYAVEISADGSRVAGGAPRQTITIDGYSEKWAGVVQVFELKQNSTDSYDWVQMGQNIEAEFFGDLFGEEIALSCDGLTVAVGARHFAGDGFRKVQGWQWHLSVKKIGQVRVHKFDEVSTEWKLAGQPIVGKDLTAQKEGYYLGSAVAMSACGNVLAVGQYQIVVGGYIEALVPGTMSDIKGEWMQKGDALDGELPYDGFGEAISISGDGSTLAVGSPIRDDKTARKKTEAESGRVYVYSWDSKSFSWTDLGEPFTGAAIDDHFGGAVVLSQDGSVLAIGAYGYEVDGKESVGLVRIFEYSTTSAWSQLGQDLVGDAESDHFGQAVALSGDGFTVAVGAPESKVGGNKVKIGYVRTFQYDATDTAWNTLGDDITGTPSTSSITRYNDKLGSSVSLSSDGSIMAIGVPGATYDTNALCGRVVVLKYDSGEGAWTERSEDLIGERNENLGTDVALSCDGSVMAVSLPSYDFQRGIVRVFQFDGGSDWIQLGSDIQGDERKIERKWFEGHFGRALDLSCDGTTLVVGNGPANHIDGGAARVFRYDVGQDEWLLVQKALDSKRAKDGFGLSVAVSSDGTRVAGGAPASFAIKRGDASNEFYDTRLLQAGRAYVYEINY